MAKGKYAARAANRLVQTDNELLRECIKEREQLKAELLEAKHSLHRERSERNSMALRLAEEKADGLVSAANSAANKWRDERDELGKFAADWITEYIMEMMRRHPEIASIPKDYKEFITEVVGGEHVGKYYSLIMGESPVGDYWKRRSVRRLRAKNLPGIEEFNRQRQTTNLQGAVASRKFPGLRRDL